MALCAQLSFRRGRAAPPIRLRDPGTAGMTNRQASGLLTPLGKPGYLRGCRDSLCLPVHACARVCTAACAQAAHLHTRVPARTQACALAPAACVCLDLLQTWLRTAAAPPAQAPTERCQCPRLRMWAGCSQRASARQRSPAFGWHVVSGLPFCTELQVIDC